VPTDTLQVPPPVIAEIPVERVKGGKDVVELLWVEFHHAYLTEPPALVIAMGWRDGTWRVWDKFDLFARPIDLPGLLFYLRRFEEPGDERPGGYETFIGPEPSLDRCQCQGMGSAVKVNHVCKHAAALRWAVDSGLLSRTVATPQLQGVQ
jgi:hypothetical protein